MFYNQNFEHLSECRICHKLVNYGIVVGAHQHRYLICRHCYRNVVSKE